MPSQRNVMGSHHCDVKIAETPSNLLSALHKIPAPIKQCLPRELNDAKFREVDGEGWRDIDVKPYVELLHTVQIEMTV